MALSKIVWIAPLVVIGYDVVASVASLLLGFRYAYAGIGSAIIYGMAGFFAARQSSLATTLVVGLAAGLSDATVGWGISWAIGPGRTTNSSLSMSQWSLAAISVTVFAVICAFVGSLIARLLQSRGIA